MYEFQREDAYRFASHIRAEAKVSGDELHFKICPYCNPKPTRGNVRTFSINLKTGQFKCLRASCGAHGNMLQLSKDFDFSLGSAIDEYYQPRKKYRQFKTAKEPIKPKEPAVKYLESRKISESVTKKYEITVQNKNDKILVFPFYDEKGRMQFVKYRKTDFDKEKDKNKEWCEEGCKPILFGMKQCNGKFDRLIVTEGQLDSLSVAEAGIENAVSVPTGAQGFTWVPYCWDWVGRFEEIVVFGDFEHGHMTLLEDFKKRFRNKIRYVREEDYRGCKDANEILCRFGKDAVRMAVKNAQLLPVERVIELADVESVNIYELEKLKTGIAELDQTLYGGLPFGTVCIVSGKRGEGKSTFASQILAQALDQGYKTFAYSGELPNYLFKSWLDFQIAGRGHIIERRREDGSINRYISANNKAMIDDWYRERAYIYDNRIIEDDEREDLLKTIESAVMQYGIRIVLLDNLMTAMYLDEVKSSDKYDRQGRFVRQLTKIALRHDVLILLVAHRRKNGFSTDANDEISGSGDITNLAGITLSYERKNELEPSQRNLIVAKNRLFGKINTNGIILDYDEKSKRIYTSAKELDVVYGWDRTDGFQTEFDDTIPFDA